MRLVIVLMLLCLAGCAKDLTPGRVRCAEGPLPPSKDCREEPTSDAHNLTEPKITYLGVGGWLLNWHGEGLLLAPSFSNPSLPPIFVRANEQRIADYLPDVKNVKVLLIGHAHYDHLLDVPVIMQRYAPDAIAYGNRTAGHILAVPKLHLKHRFVNVEQKMYRVHCATPKCYQANPDQWTTVGHVRFMAIQSKHAPHFAGVDFLKGSYYEDLKSLPVYVRNWKEGTTLAFLIDLLDDAGKPAYRIHYQDSASNPPFGFPPLIADGKEVDVMIMCAASTTQVSQYPDALLRYLNPHKLLIGHWEDFFGNDLSKQPRLLRAQKEQQMLTRINTRFNNIPMVMPFPLSEVVLRDAKPPPKQRIAGREIRAMSLVEHHRF